MEFRCNHEKIRVEIEISGKVVFKKEYIVPVFEREKQMLIRRAERDSKGHPWALFIIRRRNDRTRKAHRKIPKDVTYFIQ